ncbi:endonuclease MutS2 [Helicobacter sp. MIT 14-3879]|uniref:endonuclease MutS2 n=1 Tax=Helicobacter sp. MIT 14-3879 TaxID=2040649 RepID=UPI000E1F5AF0|nr:Smr/MutS family protein [Helicobacter sp. MIT 14-3879]RDU63120.1 endonuclease MutS2 [Helicobacter sp. MIT 14-3879]
MEELILKKLDLEDFISKFRLYFAREQSLEIQGDINLFKLYLDELDKIAFTPPSNILKLDNEMLLLKKQGVLKLEQIFEFIKIIKYFLYLKKLNLSNFKYIPLMLEKISIPQDIFNISNYFDNDGNILEGKYEKLDFINKNILTTHLEIKKQINKLLQNSNFSPYLVDKQIHLIDSKESLLVSAGFNKILKGQILHRTQAGYFYVFPNNIANIYDRLETLKNEKEMLIYEIEKEISNIFLQNILFLKFINKEFDRFDSMQARIFFAKNGNYNFVLPNKKNEIILCDFCHPNISNPTPCSISFKSKILIITGVNAGGKTMLLKSILSAAFLAKYLIPFRINPFKSKISYFKDIYAIINDPQNSKNDISTFAGRMLEFSKLLDSSNTLLGIDEIELGTDANEASALYFAILEYLQNKNMKIIITTHHKLLASKMTSNPNVELVAAMYDEKRRLPIYKFLEGCIGKSYAFDSALRYKIPHFIVNRAKEIYGDDLENLNELIEQTSLLKTKLLKKEQEINKQIEINQCKSYELDSLINKQNSDFKNKILELESIYNKALYELREVLKKNDTKEIHRFLNKQHKEFSKLPKESVNKNIKFQVGDRIYYGKNAGSILSIKADIATIELDYGIKLKTKLSSIKLASIKKQDQAQKIDFIKNAKSCNISLDLHGKRVEEALELLDKYISDCLLAGFDEVLIYHGIGNGVLSNVVREFLSSHPKVKSFSDAPSNSGGYGAKVVRF